MESFQLNNGNTIPSLGIGTFTLKPKEAEKAVKVALTDGIRSIDTANAYMNEKAVGRAIQNSNVDRKDIYLSTKLWPSVYAKENAIDDTD